MTTSTSNATPKRAVAAMLSTPFWIKRLPPVKGNTRSVLMASLPFNVS
jgi:hypothetical protein